MTSEQLWRSEEGTVPSSPDINSSIVFNHTLTLRHVEEISFTLVWHMPLGVLRVENHKCGNVLKVGESYPTKVPNKDWL